ncbi:MAG: biotin--[acetyl-CoA-carboxylase] ligase [Thermodesulfobacteriota bacterium]
MDRVAPEPVLSQALVAQLLASEELPLRQNAWPAATAAVIIRRGAIVASHIERHLSCTRTMDRARRLIDACEERGESFPSGMVVIADEVRASQGRFHRAWYAPRGGLWLTLVLVDTLIPSLSHLYPLAAGVACCEALQSYGLPARVKWVNDVLLHGRKVAGILTEAHMGRSGERYILLGIGINANNAVFPPELTDRAVAMAQVLPAPVDLELLAARLCVKLTWNLGLLLQEEERLLASDQGPEAALAQGHALLTAWLAVSDTVGRRVLFGYDVVERPEYEARVLGLDVHGFLRLAPLPGGPPRTETAGEIIYLD